MTEFEWKLIEAIRDLSSAMMAISTSLDDLKEEHAQLALRHNENTGALTFVGNCIKGASES